jgi:hypothetical protein
MHSPALVPQLNTRQSLAHENSSKTLGLLVVEPMHVKCTASGSHIDLQLCYIRQNFIYLATFLRIWFYLPLIKTCIYHLKFVKIFLKHPVLSEQFGQVSSYEAL